jgi:ribosome biogenesis GTPase A
MKNEENLFPKSGIQWYPGHMAKTKRLIKEMSRDIDVVIEVVDARVPSSSRVDKIDGVMNKPRLIIITKRDLCDEVETRKFIKDMEKEGNKVIFTNLNDGSNIVKLVESNLLSLLKDKHQKLLDKGMKIPKIKALVIGVPNVGKSTLINRLVGRKSQNVGNMPGVTKQLSWIRINDKIDLLDSPGILAPKLNQHSAMNLSASTVIKEEILPLDEVVTYILKFLYKYYPMKLKERYGIINIDDNNIIEAYDQIGKARGCLLKGNEIDYDRVITIVINDVKNGQLKGITFDRYE